MMIVMMTVTVFFMVVTVRDGRSPCEPSRASRRRHERGPEQLAPGPSRCAQPRQAAAPRPFTRRGSRRKPIPPAIIVAAPTSRNAVSAAPVSASCPSWVEVSDEGVRAGVGQTGGTLALLDGLGAAVRVAVIATGAGLVRRTVRRVGGLGGVLGGVGGLVGRRRGGRRGRAGRRARDGGRRRGRGARLRRGGRAAGNAGLGRVALGSPSGIVTPIPTPPPPPEAEATPAAVSEAPAAITTPAAMRATRIRVFMVICLLPPVADRQWSSARGHGVTGGSLSPPVHMRPGDTHATRHHSQFSQQRQGRCVRDVRISDICLPCGHVTVT